VKSFGLEAGGVVLFCEFVTAFLKCGWICPKAWNVTHTV